MPKIKLFNLFHQAVSWLKNALPISSITPVATSKVMLSLQRIWNCILQPGHQALFAVTLI